MAGRVTIDGVVKYTNDPSCPFMYGPRRTLLGEIPTYQLDPEKLDSSRYHVFVLRNNLCHPVNRVMQAIKNHFYRGEAASSTTFSKERIQLGWIQIDHFSFPLHLKSICQNLARGRYGLSSVTDRTGVFGGAGQVEAFRIDANEFIGLFSYGDKETTDPTEAEIEEHNTEMQRLREDREYCAEVVTSAKE